MDYLNAYKFGLKRGTNMEQNTDTTVSLEVISVLSKKKLGD